MELTNMRGQGLIATSLQQPLPATVLYSAKDSPWQPVLAQLPLLANGGQEIPKESIIANTDFTTTSVIAKRRLSSKKRKKQHENSSDETKPAQSPSITSTQPSIDDPSTKQHESLSVTSSQPPLSRGVVGPSPPLLTTIPQCVSIGTIPNQVVGGPLPPEMAYHLIQEQSHPKRGTSVPINNFPTTASNISTSHQDPLVFCKPISAVTQPTNVHISHPHSTNGATTSQQHVRRSDKNQLLSEFKWSNAHVFIAHRIQQHQEQIEKQQRLHQQQKLHQQQIHHHLHTSQHNLHPLNHQSIEMAAAHQQLLQQQQQQQQMALLQLYGCYPIAIQHDPQHVQLQQSGFPPALVSSSSSSCNQQQLPQFVGVHLPGMYSGGGVPVALATPSELGNVATATYLQGGGSWVAPAAVPIVGSCVINPMQPGLLATTSWVK